MADRTIIALALLLAITAGAAQAVPSPHPPMPERASAGAGVSALPLGLGAGGRGEAPPLALVLGVGPDRKLAALDTAAIGWMPAARSTDAEFQYLAIVLSALALSWLGPARRQAAYRWIVRK